MSTMSFKIYLARAGGSGEDETYALDNGVAILGFREYASLAGAKDYDDIVSIVKAATKPPSRSQVLGSSSFFFFFSGKPFLLTESSLSSSLLSSSSP